MGVMPEQINTRKIALVAEYGFSSTETAEDGFDETGFVVLGEHPDKGQVVYAHNEPIKTRIVWLNARDAKRAREAMVGDFEEMFGISIDQALPRRTT